MLKVKKVRPSPRRRKASRELVRVRRRRQPKRRKFPLITDALYYLTENAGSVDRAQGVVVGLVSAIVSIKPCSYEDAIEIVRNHLPACFRENALPELWRNDILERTGDVSDDVCRLLSDPALRRTVPRR